MLNDVSMKSDYAYWENRELRTHQIEALTKLTLALSCIIFFFIGAPLGAIIRKGGLGVPVIVSVLVFIVYATDLEGSVYDYAIQILSTALVCYLLWRVETLSDLSIAQPLPFSEAEETSPIDEAIDPDDSLSDTDSIGSLLQQYCIDAQLYLQHDLTLLQLAQAIGTNRSYLSLYFSRQGMTYNAYINDLRIRHFIELYRQAVAEQRPFTAQQLASESGYRSYSTFSLAFKQRMGQNVTAWMHEPIES
jgi:AraC-like DNA-binding protein